MNRSSRILDEVIESLETRARKATNRDAIDRILAEPSRRPLEASLRDHEAVRAFRSELADGMIRVDTANRLLGLIGKLIAVLSIY